MRELTVDLFVTVDGAAEGTASPAYFGYDGPELAAWVERHSRVPHVMLLGATTYRLFAGMAAADAASAGPMDDIPKVVFSRTVPEPPTWPNTTVVREDVAVAVPAMKDRPGDPLRVVGSLSLGRSLLALGLVDRYRLVVFPQVLGRTGAEPAFRGLPDLDLELAASSVLDGRLVVLEYVPRLRG